jgi:hypothetical protein
VEAVSLPLDLLNRVGAYLSNRPFREVAGLMAELDAAAKAAAAATEPTEASAK